MITVFGATGTIGAPLLASLRAKGARLRAVTHNPDRCAALQAKGHEVVVADFDNPQELEKACKGADRAFLVTPAHPDMRRWKANAITAATRAGVRHMVMSTGLGASPKSRMAFPKWHSESQEMLKHSGVDWTLIQPTYFMQNILWQADTIAAQSTYLDDLGGPISWVDARDIADVAAEALTGDGHQGKAYGLTGAESLDGDEIAALLGKVTGREITVRPVATEESLAAMEASGMDRQVASAMAELAGLAPKGYLAGIETTIEDVLGRPARRFADFLSENKAAFQGRA